MFRSFTIKYLLCFLFTAFPLHAQFDAGRWVVPASGTPAYAGAGTSASSASLPYAYAFKAKGKRNGRLSFQMGGKELWVDIKNVLKMEFSSQDFSEESALFLPSEIKGKDFTFFYKKGIYRLDTASLSSPSKISEAPSCTAAYYSADKSLMLLAGSSPKGLNLAFLIPAHRKFIPLSILAGDASLVSAEFSPDQNYAALNISLGEDQRLLVYRVDTGELLSSTLGVEAFRWAGKNIVGIKKTSLTLISPEGAEILLYTAPKNKKEIQAVIALPAEEFLIDVEGVVYRLDGDGIEKTAYPSIERSAKGSLQRSEKNGDARFTYQKKILRPLSGKNPRWDFVAFAGDESLIYSEKSATGAISTLYFYDAVKNESLPYRWVEEPAQVLENGLAYEAVEDTGELWLFFENPGGKASMLRLNEILN